MDCCNLWVAVVAAGVIRHLQTLSSQARPRLNVKCSFCCRMPRVSPAQLECRNLGKVVSRCRCDIRILHAFSSQVRPRMSVNRVRRMLGQSRVSRELYEGVACRFQCGVLVAS